MKLSTLLFVMVAAVLTIGTELLALEVGEEAPRFRFEDIQGRKAATDEYQGWTIVYTFADRKSNETLLEWIYQAGKTVARKDPMRKIAYINFADVKIVPKLLRGIVKPILKRINDKTNRKTEESYRQGGIENIFERFAFHLVPDWTGAYLESFGISDAANYRIWIVDQGRVVAALDSSQNNVELRFLEAFDKLSTSEGAKAQPAKAN